MQRGVPPRLVWEAELCQRHQIQQSRDADLTCRCTLVSGTDSPPGCAWMGSSRRSARCVLRPLPRAQGLRFCAPSFLPPLSTKMPEI